MNETFGGWMQNELPSCILYILKRDQEAQEEASSQGHPLDGAIFPNSERPRGPKFVS